MGAVFHLYRDLESVVWSFFVENPSLYSKLRDFAAICVGES